MNSELQAIEDRERQDRQARDMFAAAALQAILGNVTRYYPGLDDAARMAFEAADAMMRKRGGS